MTSKIQKCCRACGGEALTPLFSLGGDDAYVICDKAKSSSACGLVQRAEQLPSIAVPVVPVSQTQKHRYRSVVTETMEMLSTRDGKALDIGCADGALSSQFPRWIETYGTNDTANRLINPAAMVGQFPEPSLVRKAKSKAGDDGYDVITSIDHFASTLDAKAYFKAVQGILGHDGVFVLETPYLSLALTRNDVSQFGSRAQGIYTLSVLEKLATLTGLKIVRGGMSETAGGSVRLFFTHMDYDGYDFAPWLDQLARLWDEETALHLVSRQPFQAMLHRLEESRQRIGSLIREMVRYGEHAHVLGADARMLSQIQNFEFNGDVISAIVDNHIAQVPGDIDVITEAESREAPPDIYIAPSHNRREVLENWRDEIFNGVRVVFLSPEIEIISRETYATALGKCLAVTDGPGSVETLRSVLAAVRKPKLVAINSAYSKDVATS